MDGEAYTSREYFLEMLGQKGYTVPQVRDLRYKAYIHMKTAADGAQEFYTLANNTARDESPEQAIERDQKLQSAWVGHPHLRIIDNSTDFETKKKRVLKEICHVLGIPEPLEIERKFLIDPGFTSKQIPVTHADIEIVQHYLEQTDKDKIERVRKRVQFNTPLYIHTTKQSVRKGVNIEIERFISKDKYVEFLERQDRSRYPVKKTRSCFLWENQYFEFDSI